MYDGQSVTVIVGEDSSNPSSEGEVSDDAVSEGVSSQSEPEVSDVSQLEATTDEEGEVQSNLNRQFPIFSIIDNDASNRRMIYSTELTDFAFLTNILQNIGLEDLIDEYNRTAQTPVSRPVGHMESTILKLSPTEIDESRLGLVLDRIYKLLLDSEGRFEAKHLLSGVCNLCSADRDEKTLVSFALFDGDRDGYLSRDELHALIRSLLLITFGTYPSKHIPLKLLTNTFKPLNL